jgi:hypothetical protein
VSNRARCDLRFLGLLGLSRRPCLLVRIEKPSYTGPNVDPGIVAAPATDAADDDADAGVDAPGAGNEALPLSA